ncbi:PEP-CTERM sorting domain-containing protein [Aerosakkonema funiforme]|uniref:PEP-CTERM sorting domain-containing protein n=1 Tax=Aerosakkonema funiforme TaxID=1246630 RepID=UPI0035BB3DC5
MKPLHKIATSATVAVTAALGFSANALAATFNPSEVEYHKLIVAGDPNGTPPDSPSNRVDPNTTTSPFAGVGSLLMDLGGGSGFLCTGAAISSTHILTAGHCLDEDDNGTADFLPNNVRFNLNFGSDLSHTITASALNIHPDYTGFANPTINDDMAIITLSEALPDGVPIYNLFRNPVSEGETFTMVGYGTTGNGIEGFTGGASLNVKRVGYNNADLFDVDDEGSGVNEVFYYDFDGPDPSTNLIAGLTLGNDIEGSVGPGDSGGPSFVMKNGSMFLAGVNTFTFTVSDEQIPGTFGTGGGGILVSSYTDWIDGIVKPKSVPEPSSVLGTLMLGALGTGSWLKRKQKKGA